MIKKLKLTAGTTVLILALLIVYPLLASSGYCGVFINGSPVNIETISSNGKIYVPVDTISKALGAGVQYDSTQNTISITHNNNDETVPKVLEAVSPSVVGVIGRLKDGSEYSDKFKDQIAHGTGVIVRANGEILTNDHVVKDMERIVVVLSDGSGYEAKLKYSDEDTDLALITIEKNGLKPAKFGKLEDIIT
jgi:serine protease Do